MKSHLNLTLNLNSFQTIRKLFIRLGYFDIFLGENIYFSLLYPLSKNYLPDIFERPVSLICNDAVELLNNFSSFWNVPKNSSLAIQIGQILGQSDQELRSVHILPIVNHRQQSKALVFDFWSQLDGKHFSGLFWVKFVNWFTSSACFTRVSSLGNKIWLYGVKQGPIVVFDFAQFQKVEAALMDIYCEIAQ